jgi:hypothetical protein
MGQLEKAHNCWEFITCSDNIRLYCPVYKKKDGRGCYNYCHIIPCSSKNPELTKDLPSCMECSWYKELLSH